MLPCTGRLEMITSVFVTDIGIRVPSGAPSRGLRLLVPFTAAIIVTGSRSNWDFSCLTLK